MPSVKAENTQNKKTQSIFRLVNQSYQTPEKKSNISNKTWKCIRKWNMKKSDTYVDIASLEQKHKQYWTSTQSQNMTKSPKYKNLKVWTMLTSYYFQPTRQKEVW